MAEAAGGGEVAGRYLELLAEDRPAEELEALRAELQGEVEETALGRVHDLALRASSLRQSGRRRESELAALNDTVSDLAAPKDLDDVLEAIVRRARTLLVADVSYLSLDDDEAGHTYMRVTRAERAREEVTSVMAETVGARLAGALTGPCPPGR